ncbi:hypothetical protein [Dendronalium sp. ChiSLP03b]|uniref:hypothetical protein n=1 Tax=Dendronalium sp. ChiSLP03b TaxID=3075381 RepID=UPI002AD39385|nr:hypothetical protein [Dendronalium sp. ChiSLP03b]MDZ8205244.1 hypothetical protein [Dendronalium sp. ChiSLP03b]
MITQKLYGKVLKNLQLYQEAQEIGFDYIINPVSGELHGVNPERFSGSHLLKDSNLENFIGIVNWGVLAIHTVPPGTLIPIFDLNTGDSIGSFTLNKCQYCFPN